MSCCSLKFLWCFPWLVYWFFEPIVWFPLWDRRVVRLLGLFLGQSKIHVLIFLNKECILRSFLLSFVCTSQWQTKCNGGFVCLLFYPIAQMLLLWVLYNSWNIIATNRIISKIIISYHVLDILRDWNEAFLLWVKLIQNIVKFLLVFVPFTIKNLF